MRPQRYVLLRPAGTSAMQKATLNGQPVFGSQGGETVNPRQIGNNMVGWNFSLKLKNAEVTP